MCRFGEYLRKSLSPEETEKLESESKALLDYYAAKNDPLYVGAFERIIGYSVIAVIIVFVVFDTANLRIAIGSAVMFTFCAFFALALRFLTKSGRRYNGAIYQGADFLSWSPFLGSGFFKKLCISFLYILGIAILLLAVFYVPPAL